MSSKTKPARSSPAGPPPSLQKSSSSSQNQKSILGFFQKSTTKLPSREPTSTVDAVAGPKINGPTRSSPRRASKIKRSSSQSLTPAPSSDAVDAPSSPCQATAAVLKQGPKKSGLPSPVTPGLGSGSLNSPSRKAKKIVNYAESGTDEDDEDDEDIAIVPARSRGSRPVKRRRTSVDSDSEDDFVLEATEAIADLDGTCPDIFKASQSPADCISDMDDFIDDVVSDEELTSSKKRKRPAKSAAKSSPSLPRPSSPLVDDLEMATVSTASQWTYDPDNTEPLRPRPDNIMVKAPRTGDKKYKEKAHTSEPEQRYPWLAKLTDADRNPPGHADYDPRTVYIPPMAWARFSPFEKQYWEIKQKFWDTIVFFKKGKFYELYENDATIGHQLFDLKLTDRVNMRMVGVPEMSLNHWANQFVAKGFKIARVDQCESALGKEMRERDGKSAKPVKEEKIIRRELAQVLTAGTLVDGGMLQDDMSTYCVAIKESTVDEVPAFGICFIDTATGQFHVTEFVDDVDMTKFETFVAQIRPQELLLEKSFISVKALRILKNNTGPTTLWNYLKSGKEFWSADITRREIDASDYFVSEDRDNLEVWPKVLRECRGKDLLMSAFGALVQYLRMLKIERDLLTLGNISWYDPIRKATSLVLDGQTLINLEIFANTFDGGSAGTLFTLLNRCITPFGKRAFRQWVCHPLVDAETINARLDAVDSLNADNTMCDQFTSQLTKLPDLERLISRIHAGSCRAQDFVRVLLGFEQIEYTMSLLSAFGTGDGVIGKLITAMPDLKSRLSQWKDAFDRTKAKEDDILVPERGVEGDFDESQDRIESILADLESLLKKYRRDLGSTSIVYRDNGKEIYQLEVPIKVKGVPKAWDQMSATQKVKRYYSPELRGLVRQLQEAQETHAQIVKEVAGRFYRRFDEDYAIWLGTVKIVAQLDCLISLAKASAGLGGPSCRPTFVDDDRSVIEFEELRHPCMLPSVSDFIPNDIQLGGERANINLLTGANAAGKSTILRMTCVAVIMAQIGCYVPCQSARLTPVDRIMSRLGANDNIFAAQSTFFVELSETKKILSEASPRSLVILDELGRGTSSYDGVAVAQSVLHHVATHIGCTGFFATHYHSLATEFSTHPEIAPKRMQIHVDDANRRITFLYKVEAGVAEGSFGMHCAAMCGIPDGVIERAEVAAKEWEYTSRVKESLDQARSGCWVPLGMQSDVAWLLRGRVDGGADEMEERGLSVLLKAIEAL
ncbi:MAG: DNA mismatch repair protein msh6 [Caeruleum heppii]|nr:MAG: DNA mismatch repair protein msh6 [Caeruleum heppii]